MKSQGIGACHMNTSVKIPLGSYEYQVFISACILTFKCFDVIFIGREVEDGMLGTENQPQSWWVKFHWEKISEFSTVLYNLLILKIKQLFY